MAQQYFTFGPCSLQTSTGASNAFETVGLTVDGGKITLDIKEVPVMSDAGGPQAEAEIQQMGMTALIECSLVAWDDAILDKMMLAGEASATLGQTGAMGALLGTGGFLKGLYLPSSTDRPWYFPTAKLLPNDGNFGSEHTKRRVRFKAIRFIPGTALTVGTVYLFKRAAPP